METSFVLIFFAFLIFAYWPYLLRIACLQGHRSPSGLPLL